MLGDNRCFCNQPENWSFDPEGPLDAQPHVDNDRPPRSPFFIKSRLLPDCMAPLLVNIRLLLTSVIYFPWVPCTCNNKAISANLSKLVFTLEEQWWEPPETQTSELVRSTHVRPANRDRHSKVGYTATHKSYYNPPYIMNIYNCQAQSDQDRRIH